MSRIAWIAVDWGTSNLRVWALDGADRPVAEAASDKGMASLAPSQFEAALLEVIAPFLGDSRLPVLCCGMVGSRQGWAEARYLTAPCRPPDGSNCTKVATRDPRIAVAILPGVKQPTPPDVMRGEETQIAGLLHQQPGFDGVICLPGTHSKWVQIRNGQIARFATCMTGELFALLSEQSVLRHSVAGKDFNPDSFSRAVGVGLTQPEQLATQLFQLRAAALLADLSAPVARARLSGLLIGAELAATQPYWQGQPVAIIGAPALSELYATALAAQGVETHRLEASQMTLQGLAAARRAQQESP